MTTQVPDSDSKIMSIDSKNAPRSDSGYFRANLKQSLKEVVYDPDPERLSLYGGAPSIEMKDLDSPTFEDLSKQEGDLLHKFII